MDTGGDWCDVWEVWEVRGVVKVTRVWVYAEEVGWKGVGGGRSEGVGEMGEGSGVGVGGGDEEERESGWSVCSETDVVERWIEDGGVVVPILHHHANQGAA